MKKIVSKFYNLKESLTKKELLKLIKYHYFKIIASIIIAFFSFVIYLSLPAFFQYESFDTDLKKKISEDFNLGIKNIKGINYSFIPSPHFIIEESNFYLSKEGETKEIVKAKKIKIFISIVNLFNKEKVVIKKITLRNNNFYLRNSHIKEFFLHLNNKTNKPIYIYNSNFFFVDNSGQITSISPIKQLKYFVDFKKNQKILNISGKLFDTDFKYLWKKNYSKPNVSQSNLYFKSPNIKIENQYSNKNNKIKGVSKLNFLNNKLNLDVSIDKNKIIFQTLRNNIDLPDKIELDGIFELSPFFFNANLSLSNINIHLILDKLFFYLYTFNNSIHSNFNGNLKINFKDLNNKLFQDIFFNLKFSEEKIKIIPSSIGLKKIGRVFFSDINYFENSGDLYLESDMKLEVYNKNEFYRKFQIPKRKRIDLREIYFKLKKGVNYNNYFISDINLNNKKGPLSNNQNTYAMEEEKFNNLHQLAKIIREKF